MKSRIDDSAHAVSVQTSHDTSRNFLELLGYILADAESDISTAALDLALSDASFVRLRRARDRVRAAQRLLETMRDVACNEGDAAGASPTGSEAERDLGTIAAAMREAVELLAREWPDEYPAGAVESVKLTLYAGLCCNCTVHKIDECKPSKVFHRHRYARRAAESASRVARLVLSPRAFADCLIQPATLRKRLRRFTIACEMVENDDRANLR